MQKELQLRLVLVVVTSLSRRNVWILAISVPVRLWFFSAGWVLSLICRYSSLHVLWLPQLSSTFSISFSFGISNRISFSLLFTLSRRIGCYYLLPGLTRTVRSRGCLPPKFCLRLACVGFTASGVLLETRLYTLSKSKPSFMVVAILFKFYVSNYVYFVQYFGIL